MSGTPLTRLGKYEIRATLGKGAMGTVYHGMDLMIDRRVAIKTVRLPDANDEEAQEGLARFKREAQAAGRLNHPNIVGVFDYGETADLAYIVMEFVDGRSLKDLLEADARLPLSETLRLMDDVLAGLSYSHERGVVHRDIKPANIMITGDGRAKIADFGIARIENSSITQAGTVLGTPAYMSPEQFMGQVVDRRTDIYSSGTLLYQLLTGEKPFEGGLTTIMHKVLNTVPPAPSDLSVTAPPELDAVVAQAMARRPEDRFADAAAFALALRTRAAPAPVESDSTLVLPAPGRPPPPPPIPVPPEPVGKPNRIPLIAAAGVIALLVAAGVGWLAVSPAPPRQIATAALPLSTTPVGPGGPGSPATSPVTPVPVVDVPRPIQTVPPPTDTPPPVQTAPVRSPPPPTQPPVIPAQIATASVTPVQPPANPPAETSPTPAIPMPATQAPPSIPPPVPAARTPDPVVASTERSPAALRSAIAAALPAMPCSLAYTSLSDAGSVGVTGLAGAGAPVDALRQAAAGADVHVDTFDGPFCRTLDVLRPFAQRDGAARLALSLPGGAVLHDNDLLLLGVGMPEFGGHIQVDYVQHDSTVSHQAPSDAYPDRTYLAGEHAEFGRKRGSFPGWPVGPPFGTDMVVVIGSTAPLFAKPRTDGEPLDAYLRDLQAAASDLRRRGGNLAANAVLVRIEP